MYLKSLEVQGYKSFANKIEFIFDTGITAVVGPNGSGKSNVADAIRWVLGEQSYRSLRGKKTEDMIFSGSDGRARLGMASAELVLDNSDHWIPVDFSEVTIARRAYRSGENEYYLNGSRVRLKDINELLAKGGLSRQTYTVVGQGMIDRVLSLHADERRQLFEEAAGITFHRQKRAGALEKLQSTQDNLLRLHDIVKEVEPQLRRLEKQAERAEEYTLIKVHLDGLLRVWYGFRWGRTQENLREATARLHHSDKIVKQQRERLRQMSFEIDVFRTEQSEVRTQLSQWYGENNELSKQAETMQRELAVIEERAQQYAAQRQEILREVEQLTADLETRTQQITQAEESLLEIEQALAQGEQVLSSQQRQVAAHQAEQQNVISQRKAAEERMQQLTTELTQRQTRLAQFTERRETLVAEQELRSAEIAQLHEKRQALEAKQQELDAKLTEIDRELLALETQQTQQRENLSELNEQAEQLKAQLAVLGRREESLRARFDVLDKLRNDMAGYYAGVRAIMDSRAGLSGIIGTVSQVIQAPPDLEVALEAALGGRLQNVVVERFADAEAAIAYLKQTRRGRATLLPLDTLRVGRSVEAPNVTGVVGLASQLVTVPEERLRPVVEFALNRTVVVDDLPAARRTFQAIQGGFQIVTREGELMRSGGAVTGGRSAGKQSEDGTLLAREREWRAIPGKIEALTKEQEAVSTQLADVHEQANSVKKAVQQLTAQQQEKSEQRREVQTVADKASRSLEQLSNSIEWQQGLQAKAGSDLETIDQRREEDRQKISELEQQRQTASDETQQLVQQVEAMSAESLLADLNRARADVAAIKAEQTNQQSMLDNYRATHRQLSAQINAKQARTAALATERETLLKRQTELQQQIGQFDSKLAELAHQIQMDEQKLTDLEHRQIQLQHDERHLQQRLQRIEAEHNRLSLEAARSQDELDNLQRQIHEDLGLVQLEMSEEQIGQPILPLGADLPVVELLPAGVEEDVKRLKVQMRRLGSINPEAPQEYAELRDRHEFLTVQIKDLEAAVTNLREVIAKLDTTMKEAFVTTFEKVVKEFKYYFSTLFGGGEAQLLLTDPDDMLETGVDVVARPPGKRLQSLALLSGGERSLTAQALIFALLRISPTPFVIFDEVDAMLDEANVGRFRDALTLLAENIQFIVITHNRRTIEAANTLYGVSMGDDSVSQVYSLKIDDWLEEKKVG